MAKQEDTTMLRALIPAICLNALMAGGALAQTPPAATDATPPALQSPTQKEGPPKPPGTVPEVVQKGDIIQPNVSGTKGSTIKPPNVDPQLVVPAPGTPGGDTTVIPK
jgi:hypothetical protein